MRASRVRHAAILGAGALLYWLLAWWSLRFALVQANTSAVWPLAGLGVGALARFGYRFWPIILLGVFANNLLVSSLHGVDLAHAALAALGIALGNAIEALLGAWLTRRALGFPPELLSASGVFRFVLFAAILPPAISAGCGVCSLHLAGILPAEEMAHTGVTWFTANTAGILTCAPLFFIDLFRRLPWRGFRPVVEGVVLLLLLVFVGQTISGFYLPATLAQWPKSYMVIPLVLWIAFRLGRRGTVIAVLLLMAISVAGTVRGFATFPSASPEQSLLSLQLFIGVVAIIGLTVSALVYQLRFHQRALETAVAEKSHRLAAVTQEKAILTASAVHDLQSPLSGMRNLLQLVRASPEVFTRPEGDGLLADMQAAVERMFALVTGALAASRPRDREPVPLAPAPCDLRKLLHRAADAEQAHADSKRVVIHRQLPSYEVVVPTHGPMIEHIVGNFLSNAVKFSAPCAGVILALEATDGRVKISVADEGPGIPERERAQIFSGRLQSNGARPTAGESSTGLGLYLVGQLAERLGAKVTCDPAKSGGSVFALTLECGGRAE